MMAETHDRMDEETVQSMIEGCYDEWGDGSMQLSEDSVAAAIQRAYREGQEHALAKISQDFAAAQSLTPTDIGSVLAMAEPERWKPRVHLTRHELEQASEDRRETT